MNGTCTITHEQIHWEQMINSSHITITLCLINAAHSFSPIDYIHAMDMDDLSHKRLFIDDR